MIRLPDILKLEWDSQFFGIRIGKLVVDQTLHITDDMVQSWKKEGFQCLYIDTPITTSVTNESTAVLVDAGVRCLLKRDTGNAQLDPEVTSISTMTEALEALGVLAGKHSRFMRDDHFPQERSKALYTTWIKKSLHGEMGDDIYIIGDEYQPKGFIAFQRKNDHVQIGLMAILPEARNRGLSKKLLTAADHFARMHHLPYMILFTQLGNERAQHVFTQNGFTVVSSIHQYHLWI
jgi:ribosomal protein S18 acetylase RimI-like enzyme